MKQTYNIGDKAVLLWKTAGREHKVEVRDFKGKLIWYDYERNLPLCDVGSEKRTDFEFVSVEVDSTIYAKIHQLTDDTSTL